MEEQRRENMSREGHEGSRRGAVDVTHAWLRGSRHLSLFYLLGMERTNQIRVWCFEGLVRLNAGRRDNIFE